MEKDLEDQITRKIWTVEENLIEKVKKLPVETKNLPEEARSRIPLFSGDWSENTVKEYVEKLITAIKDPIRYKNRERLKGIEIDSKDIPNSVLEDSVGIDKIIEIITELKKDCPRVANALISKGLLADLLKQGIDFAKERTARILEAKPAFTSILANLKGSFNDDLQDELIYRCVKDLNYLGDAEDISLKVKVLGEFGICPEFNGDFENFVANLRKINANIEKCQLEYGVTKDDLTKLLKGKSLTQTDELLTEVLKNYSEEKAALIEEWKMYAITLESYEQEVPEPPHGINDLKKEIEELKSKCINMLGEQSMKLVGFLKGKDDFPDDMPKDEIKKALATLRPLFMKLLKEEDT